MQKQTEHEGNDVLKGPRHAAADLSAKAIEVVQNGATKAAGATERVVRKYPMTAIGVAFGGGLAIGWLGYRLTAPKRVVRGVAS